MDLQHLKEMGGTFDLARIDCATGNYLLAVSEEMAKIDREEREAAQKKAELERKANAQKGRGRRRR